MTYAIVSSGSHLEPLIGFSRAVRAGPHIAVAGTAPIGEDGETAASGDVYGQTVRCLEIVEKAIADAGGRLEDVVRTRIMLTDISAWREAAWAHGEYFGEIRPACTFVQVAGFIDTGWLVEVEADAIVGVSDENKPVVEAGTADAAATSPSEEAVNEGETGPMAQDLAAADVLERLKLPWHR
ncbi:RidA family protein [Mesorhizobium xinjiangense]|uniref:RidA family protein n=1 Tax=Mesorhizobium xinjiangense TaxID=2678685 RepID=UPI0012ED7FD7|nr:RidA family protein [Mesorhizobium xinjiangense]